MGLAGGQQARLSPALPPPRRQAGASSRRQGKAGIITGVQAAPDFSSRLIAWQGRHGRHDLPWQGSREPYRIWVSEIMLQQTQVAAVIPYYQRFMARFPDVATLAAATLDEVLAHWSGLGYYARARHLHATACQVMAVHAGRFPDRSELLQELPGIGRSTAAAIAAFARGERAAILDGNVRRVLARHFAIEGFPGAPKVQAAMWQLAESLLPDTDIEAYTQGLMDLGATVCTRARPRCSACPLAASCSARASDAVARYPAPRPAHARPERRVMLWLLRSRAADGGLRCLLERRPPAGVWGGLWSLPEHLPDGLRVDAIPAGPALHLTHGFTHFVLHITAEQRHVVADPAPAGHGVREHGDLRWCRQAQLAEFGLPAPIRLLLDTAFAADSARPASRPGR
ncbi:MAG: A/G-specific adenine glycosylase [Pseudomonadota bacterium]|nr:A/G-specific adenine glycosylase [Pseudomonadota bacterium]